MRAKIAGMIRLPVGSSRADGGSISHGIARLNRRGSRFAQHRCISVCIALRCVHSLCISNAGFYPFTRAKRPPPPNIAILSYPTFISIRSLLFSYHRRNINTSFLDLRNVTLRDDDRLINWTYVLEDYFREFYWQSVSQPGMQHETPIS